VKITRSLAERFFRNRRLLRHMPASFGKRAIYVSPDAALRWLRPGDAAFEQVLLDAADAFVAKGVVVWDIGANVGAFTLAAAHRSGAPVLAVEADSFLVELLRATQAHPGNADLEIDILPVAISDSSGVARFRIAGRGRASNGLDTGQLSTQHGESRAVQSMPALSLDDLLPHFPAPCFVKVDVEGAELLVLAGASRLLSEIRPIIFIEVGRDTFSQASEILQAARYDLFDGDETEAPRSPARPSTTNLLAIPQA